MLMLGIDYVGFFWERRLFGGGSGDTCMSISPTYLAGWAFVWWCWWHMHSGVVFAGVRSFLRYGEIAIFRRPDLGGKLAENIHE